MDMYQFTKTEMEIRIEKLEEFIKEEENVINNCALQPDRRTEVLTRVEVFKIRKNEYESFLTYLTAHETDRRNVIPQPMRISTGQPSTLETYRNIALCFVGQNENRKVIKYFDDLILKSRNGKNEIVVADESQMLILINKLRKEDRPKNGDKRENEF